MSVVEKEFEICNQKGLHARAAAAFVKCICEFDAEITVAKDGQEVDGCSILGLMMLAASKGTIIKVKADGIDADKAVNAVSDLIASKFGEEQ